MQKIAPFDMLSLETPCKCGCNLWIVDADQIPPTKAWFLCDNAECNNTRDIDPDKYDIDLSRANVN